MYSSRERMRACEKRAADQGQTGRLIKNVVDEPKRMNGQNNGGIRSQLVDGIFLEREAAQLF